MHIKQFNAGKLDVKVFATRDEMGRAAAAAASTAINGLLAEKERVAIIFAAAPSQNEFLRYLMDSDIDFTRIVAFHMDDYIGLDKDAPQGFGNFLKERLFDKKAFASVHLINGQSADPDEECRRYAALLEAEPPDIVCGGIGENGHIAFNDPPVADFNDKFLIKQVTLDEACRQQQVNDGCFANMDAVPKTAYTLTIPALMRCPLKFFIVPGKTKADAVFNALTGPVDEKCPASILRNVQGAELFLDTESASRLDVSQTK